MKIYAKNVILGEFTPKSSENEFMERYEKEKLCTRINSLPEKQRRRIILKFYYGLKILQIAKIEKCNKRYTKPTLSKVLKNLRTQATEKNEKNSIFSK